MRAREICERGSFNGVRKFREVEHLDLEARAVDPCLLDLFSGHGLNDPVNVDGAVRPQRDVHLIRVGQLAHDTRCLMEQRPELCRLLVGEIRNVEYVSLRFHDQRADAERPDTVVNPPV
jgi:hypothetical protein